MGMPKDEDGFCFYLQSLCFASTCSRCALAPKVPKVVWEEVQQDNAGMLMRAKVPGGWLVREIQDVTTVIEPGRMEQGYAWTTSLCFVPDVNHDWK